MSLFIKNIFLVQLCLILAILYPTSLANLVVEVGTRHSHQTLLINVSLYVVILYCNASHLMAPENVPGHFSRLYRMMFLNLKLIQYKDDKRLTPKVSNKIARTLGVHVDAIKWKQFPRCWPFVRGIHRWPVDSPHKGLVTRVWCFLWR